MLTSSLCSVPKFHNQSLRFLLLPPASKPDSLFPILDGASAADFVIIAVSSDQEVTAQGETVLRCLTGLGVGGSAGGVLGVVKVRHRSFPVQRLRLTLSNSQDLPSGNPTLASSTRASLQSFLTHFFPSIERVHCVSSSPSTESGSSMATDVDSSAPTPSPEATLIIRALCEKTPKGLRWRENRPRVLAERVGWEKNATDASTAAESGDLPKGFEGEELGTLVVEGVVRGQQLNANRLMHLQGYGDFKIEKVSCFDDGFEIFRSDTLFFSRFLPLLHFDRPSVPLPLPPWHSIRPLPLLPFLLPSTRSPSPTKTPTLSLRPTFPTTTSLEWTSKLGQQKRRWLQHQLLSLLEIDRKCLHQLDLEQLPS